MVSKYIKHFLDENNLKLNEEFQILNSDSQLVMDGALFVVQDNKYAETVSLLKVSGCGVENAELLYQLLLGTFTVKKLECKTEGALSKYYQYFLDENDLELGEEFYLSENNTNAYRVVDAGGGTLKFGSNITAGNYTVDYLFKRERDFKELRKGC